MEPTRFAQLLDQWHPAAPVEESVLRAVEEARGPIPDTLRSLWLRGGAGRLDTGVFTVVSLDPQRLTSTAEGVLHGLVPFAHDTQTSELCWATDAVEEPGVLPGSVWLVMRGDLGWEDAIPCGRDADDFFERLLRGEDPYSLPPLGQYWTDAHRHLAAMPQGVRPEQVDVRALHYRLLSPRELRLRERIDLAGVPCRAGSRVLLDPAGRPTALTPALPTPILGKPCAAGHEVVLGGVEGVRRFVPSEEVSLDGCRYAAGALVLRPDHPESPRGGTLAEPAIVDDIPLAPSPVRLDANLRVLGGTTSEETVVDGVRLPAQTRFERMIDREGATRLYSARAPVAWTVGGLQLEPGERFYPHDPGQPAE